MRVLCNKKVSKLFVLQVGFEDLKLATDKRYYHFRSQQLLHLDDPNMCDARLTHVCEGACLITPYP